MIGRDLLNGDLGEVGASDQVGFRIYVTSSRNTLSLWLGGWRLGLSRHIFALRGTLGNQ